MRTRAAPAYSYNRAVRNFIRALIVLHRTFGSRDLRTRLHTLIRFLTCPFLRVAAVVPRGAEVLDIGAGHGVFSALAADRGGRVVAVEPDLRKVRAIEGIRFVGGFDDAVRGSYDVIAIIDVLYKVPLDEWDALLTRCRERLRPGGMLLLKEHDPTARLKNGWNRLQERLASLLGLTLGEAFSYETPAQMRERLERLGFHESASRRIDAFYPHPHVLYTARR